MQATFALHQCGGSQLPGGEGSKAKHTGWQARLALALALARASELDCEIKVSRLANRACGRCIMSEGRARG